MSKHKIYLRNSTTASGFVAIDFVAIDADTNETRDASILASYLSKATQTQQPVPFYHTDDPDEESAIVSCHYRNDGTRKIPHQ